MHSARFASVSNATAVAPMARDGAMVVRRASRENVETKELCNKWHVVLVFCRVAQLWHTVSSGTNEQLVFVRVRGNRLSARRTRQLWPTWNW